MPKFVLAKNVTEFRHWLLTQPTPSSKEAVPTWISAPYKLQGMRVRREDWVILPGTYSRPDAAELLDAAAAAGMHPDYLYGEDAITNPPKEVPTHGAGTG